MEAGFLINTITDWSEPPRARHQVTFELAKRHKVIYISVNKIGLPGFQIKQEKENLSVLYPSFPISYKIRYRIPVLNELYQIWLFSYLKRKFADHQMINFDFSATLVNHYFPDYIYYCNDNFSRISKRINNYFIYKYHEKCEKSVASNAAFCITTSEILKEKLEQFNSNVYEIPLGGPDIKEYGIAPGISGREPGDKIRLGLVGFIKNSNTSADVINDLLNSKQFEINLIGPVDPELLRQIHHQEDVRQLGVLTGKPLYEALNRIDVAIAPYHFNKLDYGGTPNKLLVYLSLGKPTVVTYLKAIKKERYEEGIVYFVERKEDFVDTVLKAYSVNSESLMRKRIAFASENSWAKRVDNLLKIYDDHFGTNQYKPVKNDYIPAELSGGI